MDVGRFRTAYDVLEPYRQAGEDVWIGVGCIALTLDDTRLIDSMWQFDHATVATTGQVTLRFSASHGRELRAHYELVELEGLLASA